MAYTPLHALPKHGSIQTAGRWQDGKVTSALASVRVSGVATVPPDGALVRLVGNMHGDEIQLQDLEVVHVPLENQRLPGLGRALETRHAAYRLLRNYFDSRDFLEVETPNWVAEPGTDLYLDPVSAPSLRQETTPPAYLHTSPEFHMKELLAHGIERAYQICKVYRNGEVSPLHNPEFTILEWYRAWEDVDVIIEDVQNLAIALVPRLANEVFTRVTMSEVVQASCGIDLLACSTAATLEAAIIRKGIFEPRPKSTWEELFFELVIERIDPYLETQGAVFVTEWPTPLAVLAARKPADPRVALRFELYIDGVEIANGFQELTDADEQQERFEADLEARSAAGRPALPMPERFLEALRWGLPPSAGVAVGVDRLLMLGLAEDCLGAVLPFGMRP